jgi:hypothetical protein
VDPGLYRNSRSCRNSSTEAVCLRPQEIIERLAFQQLLSRIAEMLRGVLGYAEAGGNDL